MMASKLWFDLLTVGINYNAYGSGLGLQLIGTGLEVLLRVTVILKLGLGLMY